MNLTLIISSLSPGGAERVLSELGNYWIMQNHKVSLVTLASSKSQPFYPLDPRINLIQLDQLHSSKSPFARLKNIFKRIFSLRKTIQKLNPDVIISFADAMNVTALLASLGLQFPILVSERTHPKYHKMPFIYQKLRHFFYKKAFFIVVQTESAGHYFKDFLNLIVIPNSFNRSLLSAKKNSKVHHIISVGRLCITKDFNTLIHSFFALIQHTPDLTLTIYGEGPERNNLETLIQTLNLKDKVFLPGVIKNIQEALQEADLFIFPSRYEGFPNALCEAMVMGLPVIASNCSGNVDVVRDKIDGRLFPVGDINALTTLALELMNDPKQRQRLSAEAEKIPERFNSDYVHSLWDQAILKAYHSAQD